MKATTRLFAVVTKKGNYLNAYTPTGLTGVVTHPAPRPHLMYMYNNTLDKLKQLPESSVYRQSVEALTRHRLAIVESQVPAGLEEWRTRVQAQIDANPQVFGPMGHAYKDKIGGKGYVISRRLEKLDDRVEEWDGDRTVQRGEGPRAPEERLSQNLDLGNNRPLSDFQRSDVELEDEPPLSVEQISDIENKIGAGLIEEVCDVAQAEMDLVTTMLGARVWEDLEEAPVEGQWEYFKRDRHTGTTQSPP